MGYIEVRVNPPYGRIPSNVSGTSPLFVIAASGRTTTNKGYDEIRENRGASRQFSELHISPTRSSNGYCFYALNVLGK
jgi:hypothetical protein